MTTTSTGGGQPSENQVEVPSVPPGVAIGFDVMVTRFGKVYHTNRNCSYLTSPLTGMAPNHRWCPTCHGLDAREGQTCGWSRTEV